MDDCRYRKSSIVVLPFQEEDKEEEVVAAVVAPTDTEMTEDVEKEEAAGEDPARDRRGIQSWSSSGPCSLSPAQCPPKEDIEG